MLSLSNNKITKKNYTTSILVFFFASILALLLFMFYMSTSYSQTDLDSILQEQSEQSEPQLCAEGEVFNEQTQI